MFLFLLEYLHLLGKSEISIHMLHSPPRCVPNTLQMSNTNVVDICVHMNYTFLIIFTIAKLSTDISFL